MRQESEYYLTEGPGDRLWAALDSLVRMHPEQLRLLDSGESLDMKLGEWERQVIFGLPTEGWGARIRMFRLERLKAIANMVGIAGLSTWNQRAQVISWRNFLTAISGEKLVFYSGKFRNIPTPAHVNFVANGQNKMPQYKHAIFYEPRSNITHLTPSSSEQLLVFPDEFRANLLSALPVDWIVRIPRFTLNPLGKKDLRSTHKLSAFWQKRYRELTSAASHVVQGVSSLDEVYEQKVSLANKTGVTPLDCGIYVDNPAMQLAYDSTSVLDHFSTGNQTAVKFLISVIKW